MKPSLSLLSRSVFRVAHLSDIHVPPTWSPSELPLFLHPKRLLGALNMFLRRGPNVYSPEILKAILHDVTLQDVDHVVITGDVTNFALKSEFKRAAGIIHEVTSPVMKPQDITVIPGNHDIYTSNSEMRRFIESFGSYINVKDPNPDGHLIFPIWKSYVDKKVNIIGLNSALPRPLFYSGGRVPETQLERASEILRNHPSFFNIVLIHHPVVQRQKHHFEESRSGLFDCDRVRDTLIESNAHLILHGHTHKPFLHELRSPSSKKTHVAEAGSSTYQGPKTSLQARYNIYEIEKGALKSILARRLDPATHTITQTTLL